MPKYYVKPMYPQNILFSSWKIPNDRLNSCVSGIRCASAYPRRSQD